MNNGQYAAFKSSAEIFVEQFKDVKDKKIVIYGIGQYTATVLTKLKDFHVIGLLDGDTSNIGKIVYGYRVLSVKEAEETADLIIINTSSFYWDMIFKRIEDIKIPVYYANGSKACKKADSYIIQECVKISFSEMKKQIDSVDIVTFDFYDTLVMRFVYSPRDILKIVEKRVERELGERFFYGELRNRAEAELINCEYTLDDIYRNMERHIGKEKCEKMKFLEVDTEKKMTIARADMVRLFDYAVQSGKEVYILSDMYLPKRVIKSIAKQCGIEIDSEHLWISGELKKSKKDGTMWQLFAEKTEGRQVVHFGDSLIGDEEQPRNAGIKSIHIPSAVELLKNCVLVKSVPFINSIYSSINMGLILNELFNSPFVYDKSGNIFSINSCKVFGKCIFGDVSLTYLLKILSELKHKQIENLIFFARDGYFLKRSFELLCKELGINISSHYLYVSRRAILCAASEYKDAYMCLMKSDYNGNFETYLKERFDIQIKEDDIHLSNYCSMPNDYQTVKEWLIPYKENIQRNLGTFRKNYRKYLEEFDWEKSAVVDICYRGSIQYWLSKVIHENIIGFYFVADMSEENEFNKANLMIPCFQEEEDLRAEKSQIWKNHKIVESLYTAPYGTIKGIDKDGNYETFTLGNNQKHFIEREEMNNGINEFISQYTKIIRELELTVFDVGIDPKFTDALFGNFFVGDIAFGEVIKKCFWHEDSFINSSKEYELF